MNQISENSIYADEASKKEFLADNGVLLTLS